jgi:hypothetical protein
MKGYNEVISDRDIQLLLERVHGFHDAMTKELHVLNNGFVESGGAMQMGHRFDLRLLVQTQWEPHAVELIFVGVQNLELKDPGEYWAATGRVNSDRKTGNQQVRFQFDGALSVHAERLFWRERPDWIGRTPRFGAEVPLPDVVPARTIQGEWRQCSACADAFECSNDVDYVRCPSCGRLTELDGAG